nr:hypothetical protein [Bradyrhizobium brasilense]
MMRLPWSIASASCSRRPAERISEASIIVPRFKTKPDFSICAVIRAKALCQLALGQLFAETPQRGMIRHRLTQRQAQKAPKRHAVHQRFLKVRIGQPLRLLQQQRRKQRQRRVSWRSIDPLRKPLGSTSIALQSTSSDTR